LQFYPKNEGTLLLHLTYMYKTPPHEGHENLSNSHKSSYPNYS